MSKTYRCLRHRDGRRESRIDPIPASLCPAPYHTIPLLDTLIPSPYIPLMKTPARGYRIIPTAPGRRDTAWTVVRDADGAVVWRGKTYAGARTAHARIALHVSHDTARRMGNA